MANEFVSKDTRNPSTGRTAAQEADYQAGQSQQVAPSPPSATRNPVPTLKAPENIHPSAKGVYGAPIGNTILK